MARVLGFVTEPGRQERKLICSGEILVFEKPATRTGTVNDHGFMKL